MTVLQQQCHLPGNLLLQQHNQQASVPQPSVPQPSVPQPSVLPSAPQLPAALHQPQQQEVQAQEGPVPDPDEHVSAALQALHWVIQQQPAQQRPPHQQPAQQQQPQQPQQHSPPQQQPEEKLAVIPAMSQLLERLLGTASLQEQQPPQQHQQPPPPPPQQQQLAVASTGQTGAVGVVPLGPPQQQEGVRQAASGGTLPQVVDGDAHAGNSAAQPEEQEAQLASWHTSSGPGNQQPQVPLQPLQLPTGSAADMTAAADAHMQPGAAAGAHEQATHSTSGLLANTQAAATQALAGGCDSTPLPPQQQEQHAPSGVLGSGAAGLSADALALLTAALQSGGGDGTSTASLPAEAVPPSSSTGPEGQGKGAPPFSGQEAEPSERGPDGSKPASGAGTAGWS